MRLKPPKVLCDIAKTYCIVFRRSSLRSRWPDHTPRVLACKAHSHMQTGPYRSLKWREKCTKCKENLKKQKISKTIPVTVPHKSIKHARIRENKCREPKKRWLNWLRWLFCTNLKFTRRSYNKASLCTQLDERAIMLETGGVKLW